MLNEITGLVPSVKIEAGKLKIPKNITLADPSFPSNKIDLLIGDDLFYNLLCIGLIKLGSNLPILHKTKLEWIVCDPIVHNNKRQISLCNVSIESVIQ